ncbi:MAG: hypothetical protein ACRD0O_10060 [Acidimicrobiia bacterium]
MSAKVEPATVEPLEGTDLNRLVLTAKAVERLGIKTGEVRNVPVPGSTEPRKVAPYAAVIYDTKGETLMYMQKDPLVFVRHPVTVDRIAGNDVFLLDGPEAGTAVVTVGASELFGIEFGIGK